ncbi:hypothetical protein CD170_11645 [Staphylococcus aureus]|nr:hypothetical protein CD170_11645 [Staphylococcus aureus]
MTERKCACNKLFSILVRGPNTEADEKSAYNNVQLEYMYNNIKHAVKRSRSIQTDFAHRVFLT